MRRLRDLLTRRSRARYLLWRAARAASALEVDFQRGGSVVLRPPPTADLALAYEIFIGGAYEIPSGFPDFDPGLIVDVGANVGFAVVWFARRFPRSRLLAFEPHPAHLASLYRTVVLNELAARTAIVGAAAGARDGEAFLLEQNDESRVVAAPTTNSMPIRVRDFFAELGNVKVGLLKLDIEGGEYELLSDPRFAQLLPDNIVLEWHATEAVPNGKSWCSRRLGELGYRVVDGALQYERAGVMWAFRERASQ